MDPAAEDGPVAKQVRRLPPHPFALNARLARSSVSHLSDFSAAAGARCGAAPAGAGLRRHALRAGLRHAPGEYPSLPFPVDWTCAIVFHIPIRSVFFAAWGGEWQRRGGGRGRVGGPAAGAQGSGSGWGHGRLLVGERRGAQAAGVQLDWLQAPLSDDQGTQAQVAGKMA